MGFNPVTSVVPTPGCPCKPSNTHGRNNNTELQDYTKHYYITNTVQHVFIDNTARHDCDNKSPSHTCCRTEVAIVHCTISNFHDAYHVYANTELFRHNVLLLQVQVKQIRSDQDQTSLFSSLIAMPTLNGVLHIVDLEWMKSRSEDNAQYHAQRRTINTKGWET